MSAYFSPCRTWRYTLTRDVAPLTGVGTCTFIGLNPSTADETIDDPTIRRCARFARDWGYAQLRMLNLFAFRATDPNDLWRARRDGVDVIGPENLITIAEAVGGSDLVVCAWGAATPAMGEQVERVLELVADPRCLGLTKLGSPRHPLFMKTSARPEHFVSRPRAGEAVSPLKEKRQSVA